MRLISLAVFAWTCYNSKAVYVLLAEDTCHPRPQCNVHNPCMDTYIIVPPCMMAPQCPLPVPPETTSYMTPKTTPETTLTTTSTSAVTPLSTPPSSPCGGCPAGQVCEKNLGLCDATPCPPAYKCVPSCFVTGCPIGQNCQTLYPLCAIGIACFLQYQCTS